MGNFAKQMKRKQLQKTNKGAARGIRQANRADKQVMTAYERQNVTDMLTEIKTAQDLTIIFFVAAHRIFGFAGKRLKRLVEKMGSHIECIRQGYVTVRDIEKILEEEAHMVIDHKDIKKFSRIRFIKWRVQGEMIAAFLISLLDGWGYKKVRLERVYEEAARIADGLATKEFTMEDLKEQLTGEAKYTSEAVA